MIDDHDRFTEGSRTENGGFAVSDYAPKIVTNSRFKFSSQSLMRTQIFFSQQSNHLSF